MHEIINQLKERGYFSYATRDFVALIIIITVWGILNSFLGPLVTLPLFMISFCLMAFFTAFTALLLRKCGVVLLMLFLAATTIKSLPDLSGLGTNAYIAMLLSGLVFEVIYIFFYAEKPLVSLDVILAVSIAFASIPLFTGLLLSMTVTFSHLSELLNLMLIDFFLALIGGSLAFLIWYHIKTTQFILKFEYGGN